MGMTWTHSVNVAPLGQFVSNIVLFVSKAWLSFVIIIIVNSKVTLKRLNPTVGNLKQQSSSIKTMC